MNAKTKLVITMLRFFLVLAFLVFSTSLFAQLPVDSSSFKIDSSKTDFSFSNSNDSIVGNDSVGVNVQPKVKSFQSVISDLLFSNKFINVKDAPVIVTADKKEFSGKEFLFYALCIMVFILGIFKTFYKGYFNNLFRVFFNTSLRQTQLTDQLLQAKLPSFILNIFFAITAGTFVWLLFTNHANVSSRRTMFVNRQLLLPFCILGIGGLYFIKYCILKFIGWLSGMQQTVDNYIFIIFMVNKISGIVLVPFIIILAFSLAAWAHLVTVVSLIIVLLFFLSRYLKTYGVLEYNFPMNGFHFLIYVSATEIIPLLLLYKVATDYIL